MPSLTTWAPFCAVVLPIIPVIKTSTWLLLSRLQGNKPHRNSPEPSEPCLRNLHQHAPELSRTLRNLPKPSIPEPTSWTYASIHRNPPKSSGTCLRNLHHFTPELSGTFRNLPPEPLHQHTPELSGTFRNLPPEPAPATRTGAHRSLSGLKTPLAYAVGEKQVATNTKAWTSEQQTTYLVVGERGLSRDFVKWLGPTHRND